ncbi:MAG: hypothetical protein BWY28_03278 [bacterium ADurb.Bin236]|nr:MAG: hypothetical protein BWY28_03278 [bacterium ADurb.Bin236]
MPGDRAGLGAGEVKDALLYAVIFLAGFVFCMGTILWWEDKR